VEVGFHGPHNQEGGLTACCPEEVDPYASVVEKYSSGVDQTVLWESNESLMRGRNGFGEDCDYDHDHDRDLDESAASVTEKEGRKIDMGSLT